MAGTIGGLNVGISPQANLYGLKILNKDGEGTTEAALLAMNHIAQIYKKSARLSIVSMSLGGPCDTEDCSKDSMVRAVEKLSSMGVIVSIAAGNSGCNGCDGSPNAAPSAINGKRRTALH